MEDDSSPPRGAGLSSGRGMIAGFDWLTAQPVAHRGLHDSGSGVVENTLPAVRAAIEADYAIEIDVQPSSDGEAMVFHDTDLDRLVDGSGPIAVREAVALQRLPFHRDAALRIPRLGEVLEEIDGRVPLLIELKSNGAGSDRLEHRVVDLLRGYPGPVAVMSFDPRRIVTVRRLDPRLPRGIVSMRWDNDLSKAHVPARYRFVLRHLLHTWHTRPHFVAYDIQGLPAPGPAALRRLGLPLLTWTVRTLADRRKALRWADQIIFEGFRA